MTWVQRTKVPTPPPPALTDPGVAKNALTQVRQAPFREEMASFKGEIFLVTGPDKDLFSVAYGGSGVPEPPHLAQSAAPEAPPGVTKVDSLCYRLVPDRVLEYGDVEAHANGISEVTAAVLFHPERVPTWISDDKASGSLRGLFFPDEVMFLHFRNDGDGWRSAGPGTNLFYTRRTHILN